MKSLCPTDWLSDRVALLISENRLHAIRSANRMFKALIPAQWVGMIGFLLLTQSNARLGSTALSNGLASDIGLVTGGGLLAAVVALVLLWRNSESVLTRVIVTVAQLLSWIWLVVWTNGGPGAYFYGFASLIALSLYQDPKILSLAASITTVTVALDVFGWGDWIAISLENGRERVLEFACCYAATVGFLLLRQHRHDQHEIRVCRGQARLQQSRLDDEQLLWTRTKELKTVNRQLHDEVQMRVRAETDRERLTRKLLQASRQAGLSEVATGVLHTVGNVINSINVSADTIIDRLTDARLDRLDETISQLGLASPDLGESPSKSPRTRQLLQYLSLVSENLKDQHLEIACEVQLMRKSVTHISEVVSMQQSYARVSGAAERFSVTEVCDRAIRIQQADLDKHEIEVVRDYQDLPDVCSEPHKILQIIVDLISNAKFAVQHSRSIGGKIVISISLNEKNSLTITVQDNGMGISPENQKQIFQHGFTTRPGGNGFGLHNSILAAHELNGALECFSNGAGQGARFELTLPLDDSPATVISAAQFFNPVVSVEIPTFSK